MLSGVALQQRDWFLLLLLPIGFALLATFAARTAVLRALGKTL
jgi:cell division transport system permease protein